MSTNHLISKRPKEDLILDLVNKRRVPGEVVQYLASHQIHGIRFVYKNVKNRKSCFLNDESGLGKCFQVVAVLSALLRKSTKVLVLTQSEEKLQHFQFHCSMLLPNFKMKRIKETELDAESEMKQKEICIYLSTMEDGIKQIGQLRKISFRSTVIFVENLSEGSPHWAAFQSLNDSNTKIVSCSGDLMMNTKSLYDLLELADRLENFQSETKKEITYAAFDAKFGFGKRSASKRAILFQQKNLTSLCYDFYIRRLRSQVTDCLPLVDEQQFTKNFDAWKLLEAEASALDSVWFDSDMEIPSEKPTEGNGMETSVRAANDVRNDSCTGSQMSPLRYDSESEVDEQDVGNEGRGSVTKPIKKKGRPRKCVAAVAESSCSRSLRSRKATDYREVLGNQGRKARPKKSPETSSDVQILPLNPPSPIVLSSDSVESEIRNGQSSPDIFSSTPSVPGTQANTNEEDLLRILSQNLFSEVLPSPSTPMRSEEKSDTPNTFEITRNSAFPNRLRVRGGKSVTPAMGNETPRSSKKGLCEVRVILRKLNEEDIQELQEKNRGDAEAVVDLTSSHTPADADLDSPAIVIDDNTPVKRLELTPSKRSCVRSERRSSAHSPQTSPWLKKRNANPHENYSRKSRRKLEKWFFSINNNDTPSPPALKPRTILQKPRNRRIEKRRSRIDSPSIFSSDDE